MITNFQDRLLCLSHIVEIFCIKFGPHHPALEILFAFFQLANDLPLSVFVLSEFDPGHGTRIHGWCFSRAQNVRSITRNRSNNGACSQTKDWQSAEPGNAKCWQG